MFWLRIKCLGIIPVQSDNSAFRYVTAMAGRFFGSTSFDFVDTPTSDYDLSPVIIKYYLALFVLSFLCN